ncbi:MAG: type 2 lanthipeptide synthetase LanM family protein, partial [Actinomycetota bacterium]|nr:type 2 lanthipeptide synthetase LanM family protein [Actinomycetota bacterium]
QDPGSRSLYLKFVRSLADGGLWRLFVTYPVLARQMGTISQLWVKATSELLERLETDRPELERFFDGALGSVVAAKPSLSDRHRDGCTVVALTFASGRRLIYKPKKLGTEVAYNGLLTRLNEWGAPLRFRPLKVLDRSTHGWVEFVEHLPCQNREEARRYYERAGMLLCLFYVLEVTDCHLENIIASGEHPALIDAETLMHHRVHPQAFEDGAEVQRLANEQFEHSVLRTGLLPRWEVSADGETTYDLSGLGGTVSQDLPHRVPKWVHINTDRMALKRAPATLPAKANVPVLDDAPLGLHDHGPQLVDGFRRMYWFLFDHRKALAKSDLLRELAQQEVRFVYRPTKIYATLLSNLRDQRYLRDGADRSIYLEQLGRSQLPPYGPLPEERSVLWPVFAAERCAMEQGDVPFFTARADSDALIVMPGQEIVNAVMEPSFERVLTRLEALGDTDLQRQVGFIEGSLYAYSARDTVATRPTEPTPDEDDGLAGPPTFPEAFVGPALALAEGIRRRAILAEDGGATWISPHYLVQADRYQLQPMGFDLYGGTCGVALFLAAAERFAPQKGYGELGLAAIRPLRSALRERPERLANAMGIGGATGLGSVVYSLVRVSRLVGEPQLLEDARWAASLIDEDRISADKSLDVVSGAAGAILGLVALYETLPDRTILERATACAERLIGARTVSETGRLAWATLGRTLHTGFAHGAAGITYALLRLYEHAQDSRFLEAAQEGIAYEDTTYSRETRNWASYRREHDEPSYTLQWCYGAPGIGLARLGSSKILDTEQVREDVELALRATMGFGPQGVDRLCCGNLGRTELLLAAGERLCRPELSEVSRERAWRVVTRAERTEGFVLDALLPAQVDDPSLFRGTSGVGYELLRLARPDLLPSVLMWE